MAWWRRRWCCRCCVASSRTGTQWRTFSTMSCIGTSGGRLEARARSSSLSHSSRPRLFGTNWCNLCLNNSTYQDLMTLNRLYYHFMLLDTFQAIQLTLVMGK